MLPVWGQEQDSLLKTLCDGKLSFRQMTRFFPNRTRDAIYARAQILGVKNAYRKPPKYTYNTRYFNEVTLENCYWAAILQTDGCLSRRKNNVSIIWGCAEKDKPHMGIFKTHINSTHPIRTDMKKCGLSTSDTEKDHPHCKITLEGAHEWAAALKKNFGFDHNKTLRTSPLSLPSLKHQLAYIKGFIDGCVTQSGSESGTNITICGCNKEMLLWVKDVIDSLNLPTLSHNRNSTVHPRENENCYYYGIGGVKAAVLHEILMRTPTPYLSRKWENPKVLATVDYWKSRTDVWPSETYFSSICS